MASIPVTAHSQIPNSSRSESQPWVNAGGVAGWMLASPGRLAVSSHSFGLYFMVHEPSG